MGTDWVMSSSALCRYSLKARERNLKPWSFQPRDIDFVLLTHAHIDHSGLRPAMGAGLIATARTVFDLRLLVVRIVSVAQQHRQCHRRQHSARGPAEHELSGSAVAVATHHQQICLCVGGV
jgi:glyoxylase-like metal-dependent hydrolase (beta-lactamase superfamily II)